MARTSHSTKAISGSVQAIILNLACYLDVKQIAKYTGIGKRTIFRILRDFRLHGITSTSSS
ncbi:hypothetical protein EST38_g11414 [Candolleomyces aberdarensis]|uniref:Uncharacterized protein n=1 Tax=Candolleomyces aberdarensis TaxID=2316362 RepID=A0A4V1Q2A8_9AGAR|nr:hypothetical protein EST38_g11414 [Candolleomyces aberdarensis]